MLVAWTEFLKDQESEKVRNLEMNIEEIRSAKDELIRMSNDDKEAIGDTMLMNDKQKQYLSSLEVGEVIIFAEGWKKLIHIKIANGTDTGCDDIDDEVIKSIGNKQKRQFISSYYLK